MADDELREQIERLQKQVDDLRAVQQANDDLREEAELPYGLSRLRGVKRNEDYPETGDDE